jgi:hypothetical protein
VLDADEGQAVLEGVDSLSAEHGTGLRIEDGVGTVVDGGGG